MTIIETLDEELRRALKAGERDVVDVIRMIKTRLAEKRTSPGFTGPLTDEVAVEVIRSYIKSIEKAIDEIEHGGGAENPILRKYRFEIEYLQRYLPKMLSEEEIREIVRRVIEEMGVSGPSAVGKVMGAVMKAHRDRVDGAVVRRIVEEELGRSA